ncbi:lipopolysaccharide biosynthesis protein [Mesorhizobium sp. B1-1-5]|uniref:lipopolysaccharide biosynthesis protein n=1 Tax=Mesorhizobium sp. B1-1-5 TaxID=2589979 RepID=UPI001FF020DC|nr:lipopolysaccharide biosynthesis protein [Mesorhizobium sp. B1-1-5]
MTWPWHCYEFRTVRHLLSAGSSKLKELKGKSLRGAFAKLCGQGISFVLRLGFVAAIARLLEPADFGLVAMVTVVTSFFDLFATAGLSAATVQRADISDEYVSTLFWVNVAVGSTLGVLCVIIAPFLVAFYQEPRLLSVTAALAAGFLFNAAGVQHLALLQRSLRYGALAVIETVAQLASVATGLGMAFYGLGYWALVGAALVQPATTTLLMWLSTSWRPGKPGRLSDVRSMLRFGATITFNNLVVHLAYNFDKLMIGRYLGADALGIYGRGYQLINIPNTTLLSAVGGVAFSALSRLQGDPARCRAYFLKGYTLVNSLTLPTTMFCAIFADEIITVVLGHKWHAVAPIFRLLAPTILVFGIINPTGWFLQSTGLQGRSLKMAYAIAVLVCLAIIIGLPYGANGVALGVSAAMTVWVVPHIVWCAKGTLLSPFDLFAAIWRPLLASIAASGAGLEAAFYLGPSSTPLLRLLMGGMVMGAVYACLLLFVLGQRKFYADVLAALKPASPDRIADISANLGASR